MSNQNKLFTTYDLNLSAVLVAHGFVLEKVKKNDRGKSQFIFEETQSLKKLVDKYWKGKIKMNPQDLFTSLKVIKNRLYSNYS